MQGTVGFESSLLLSHVVQNLAHYIRRHQLVTASRPRAVVLCRWPQRWVPTSFRLNGQITHALQRESGPGFGRKLLRAPPLWTLEDTIDIIYITFKYFFIIFVQAVQPNLIIAIFSSFSFYFRWHSDAFDCFEAHSLWCINKWKNTGNNLRSPHLAHSAVRISWSYKPTL